MFPRVRRYTDNNTSDQTEALWSVSDICQGVMRGRLSRLQQSEIALQNNRKSLGALLSKALGIEQLHSARDVVLHGVSTECNYSYGLQYIYFSQDNNTSL